MNTIIPAIEARRARRALDTRPIPAETLGRIMSAATLAPSCANKQPWRFLLIDEPAALAKARPALSGGNYWALKAPVLVVAITRPDLDAQLDDRRDYALFDLGLATGNLLTQATAEGLIAHPIAGFEPLKIKEAFGIDPSFIAIAMIIIGWPGDEAGLNEKHLESEHSARSRKPEGEVVFHNAWPL
jgi:nitroreductase